MKPTPVGLFSDDYGYKVLAVDILLFRPSSGGLFQFFCYPAGRAIFFSLPLRGRFHVGVLFLYLVPHPFAFFHFSSLIANRKLT